MLGPVADEDELAAGRLGQPPVDGDPALGVAMIDEVPGVVLDHCFGRRGIAEHMQAVRRRGSETSQIARMSRAKSAPGRPPPYLEPLLQRSSSHHTTSTNRAVWADLGDVMREKEGIEIGA